MWLEKMQYEIEKEKKIYELNSRLRRERRLNLLASEG